MFHSMNRAFRPSSRSFAIYTVYFLFSVTSSTVYPVFYTMDKNTNRYVPMIFRVKKNYLCLFSCDLVNHKLKPKTEFCYYDFGSETYLVLFTIAYNFRDHHSWEIQAWKSRGCRYSNRCSNPPGAVAPPSLPGYHQHGVRFTCRAEQELSAKSCLSCSPPAAPLLQVLCAVVLQL